MLDLFLYLDEGSFVCAHTTNGLLPFFLSLSSFLPSPDEIESIGKERRVWEEERKGRYGRRKRGTDAKRKKEECFGSFGFFCVGGGSTLRHRGKTCSM